MNLDCTDNPKITQMIKLTSSSLDNILNNRDDKELLSCICFDYLMGFGYLVGGWLMHKAKIKANIKLSNNPKNKIFLKSKIVSADFYNLHILPRISTHLEIVKNGADIVKLTNDSNI